MSDFLTVLNVAAHWFGHGLVYVACGVVGYLCYLAAVSGVRYKAEQRNPKPLISPETQARRVEMYRQQEAAALARRRREESPANKRTPAPWFDEDGAA